MQFLDEGKLMFRVVLIGDSSVGKTCLVNRFIHSEFNANEANTIGAMYDTYSTVINGTAVDMQLWDTAGQEKFKSLGPVYYRDAVAAILVFDMTSHESFENLRYWYESFKYVTGENTEAVLVGNKIDLNDSIQVTREEAEKWADLKRCKFFATSAKTGENVSAMFDFLLHKLVDNHKTMKNNGFQKQLKEKTGPLESKCWC